MSHESFDTVVVGAGPGGASAALSAAREGLDVLVMDMRKEIGVPIQCGEYFPTPSELRDLLPNLEHDENVKYPRDVVLNTTENLSVVAPSGKEYLFDLESDIIDREKFDKKLIKEAASNGADVWINTTAKKVYDDGRTIHVEKAGEEMTVETDVVVAADGARSRVAKSVGLEINDSTHDLSPVIQHVMGNVQSDENRTEMYFGNDYCPGGYAWIIPRGDGLANVGLGVRKPFMAEGATLSDYLENFIEDHPVAAPKLRDAAVLSSVGGLVPCGGAIPKTYTETCMAVGDAAGHVMASNGGGVPLAVIGGEIAGETAGQHLRDGSSLAVYEEEWKRELGEELESSVRIRELADKVMVKDRYLERLLDALGEDYINEFIRCRMPFGFDRALNILQKVRA